MVDPISSGAAASLTGNGIAAPSASGPGPASMADTAQFQEALHQPNVHSAAEMTSGQIPGTESSRSVLEGIDKMSADMRAMQGDLQNATSSMGEVGDLLRMQFQAAQLTMTQTMVGQVGQKTSQGTQQLLKGQ